MNKREKDLNSSKCVSLEEGTGQVTIMKDDETLDTGKPFTFDSVFDTESTQTAVYTATAEPLVEAVMEGYNGTVFAYGQTGCGKSFSMMGVPADPALMGIIPRAFQQIFDTIAANDVPDKKYLVQGCYIEIYNEEVRDLLSSNHTARLELKEHPEKGVYIAGVSHHTVDGVEEITKLMEQGTYTHFFYDFDT
jgi:kinesin family protein 3/17